MGGPGSGRWKSIASVCKLCPADRDPISDNVLCREHNRAYLRLAQRRYRGWPEERMNEPSHYRPPELCGTCVKCGIGEVVRYGRKNRGQCRLCYRVSHRVWARKRAGWPADMLHLPPGPAGRQPWTGLIESRRRMEGSLT